VVVTIFFCIPLFFSLFYQRKHRPLEELIAGADEGKPFSQPGRPSACCSGIVTIVTATTPTNASAATIATTTNVVLSIPASGKKKLLFKAFCY